MQDVFTGSLQMKIIAEEVRRQAVLESLIVGESDQRSLSFHEYDGI